LIAQLTGKIIHKQPNTIVIDVGGVGYEVTIPLSTFYELGEVGAEVSLRVHTHVREDLIQLFGFFTPIEKELFLKVTTVSGIGPKLAVTMLSGMPAAELVQAIKNNDVTRLTSIPGIGRKTAERVVIELRDKVAGIALEGLAGAPAQSVQAAITEATVRDDTIAALMALGYPKPVAEKAVTSAMRDEGERTIEAILKRSLKRLSR
jgi:Holliday junction DNA helicase RuvA